VSERPTDAGADGNEALLISALRGRDEAALIELVRRYHALMLKLALAQVEDRSSAEDIVQKTWLAVINRIDGFQGRPSLRAWILQILIDHAAGSRKRKGCEVPFSALASADAATHEPSVPHSRFLAREHPEMPFSWVSDPTRWPEAEVLGSETHSLILGAIEALPPTQRIVITLRDLEGWRAGEICDALDISDGKQRVLLHSARSSVRETLDVYLRGRAP
jgi:RNA polymerase sigma-70 factor (ECF subfamily)